MHHRGNLLLVSLWSPFLLSFESHSPQPPPPSLYTAADPVVHNLPLQLTRMPVPAAKLLLTFCWHTRNIYVRRLSLLLSHYSSFWLPCRMVNNSCACWRSWIHKYTPLRVVSANNSAFAFLKGWGGRNRVNKCKIRGIWWHYLMLWSVDTVLTSVP